MSSILLSRTHPSISHVFLALSLTSVRSVGFYEPGFPGRNSHLELTKMIRSPPTDVESHSNRNLSAPLGTRHSASYYQKSASFSCLFCASCYIFCILVHPLLRSRSSLHVPEYTLLQKARLEEFWHFRLLAGL